MMYWAWKKHGIRPSEFYKLRRGELVVLRAFFLQELDEEREKMKALEKSGMACPYLLLR